MESIVIHLAAPGTARSCDRVIHSPAPHSCCRPGVAVVPLPQRCWPAICKLAGKLCAESHVRHADVTAALGLSVDPDTAAIELAHIRAGCAPGSFTVSRHARA